MSIAPVFRASPLLSLLLVSLAVPVVALSELFLKTYFARLLGLSILLIVACFLASILLKKRPLYRRFTIFLAPAILLKFALGLELFRQVSLGAEKSSASLSHLIDPVIGGGMHLGVLALLAVVAVHLRSRSTANKIERSIERIVGDWAPSAHSEIERDNKIGLRGPETRERHRGVAALSEIAEELEFLGYCNRWDFVVSLLWLGFGFLAAFIFDGSLWGQIGGHNLIAGLIGAALSLLVSTTLGVLATRLIRECRCIRDTEITGLEEEFPSPESVVKATVGLSFEGVALAGFGLPPGTSVAFQLVFQSVAAAISMPSAKSEGTDSESQETLRVHEPESASIVLELGEEIRSNLGLESTRLSCEAQIRYLSEKLGLPLPSPSLTHNAEIDPCEYRICMNGNPIDRGELRLGELLATGSSSILESLDGELVWAAGSRFPAKWIPSASRGQAETLGCEVRRPSAVLTHHVLEFLSDNAAKFLTRPELRIRLMRAHFIRPRLLRALAEDEDRLLDVLRNLLLESVSIKDLVPILKAILEGTEIGEESAVLTEFTRSALSEQICCQHQTPSGKLHVLKLSTCLEDKLQRSLLPCGELRLERGLKDYLVWELGTKMTLLYEEGLQPALLTPAEIRFPLRQLTRSLPDLVILSDLDLTQDAKVNVLGEVLGQPWYTAQAGSDSQTG